MSDSLSPGLYDELLHQDLVEVLRQNPELRSVFGKLETEEEPARYAAFISRVLKQVLREERDPGLRLKLCNQVIDLISGPKERPHHTGKRLVSNPEPVLLEVTPPRALAARLARPETPLAETVLFTGSPKDPPLAGELAAEMASADQVDILVSFIKWSGLRLLMSAFEDLRDRNVPVRLITTSYMGASDAPAVEWLAKMPNVKVCVSYDTKRTRLHAKAYHFYRASGFSTAYIGSANMSDAAMTSGLEWNLKVTAQDMGHILERFVAEFDTYWHSQEFQEYDVNSPGRLRDAIARERNPATTTPGVFFDLRPHPFQERILDALKAERKVHGHQRNLVIAATGTGKTIVAAFDFERFFLSHGRQARLLYVAHRQEILVQALGAFRNVLRKQDFGELLVGGYQPGNVDHLFCSVGMLRSRKLWEQVGPEFYDYIVVDEAHHGTSPSYRPIFDHLSPHILLGLTATPERMDGQLVATDFGNRYAAEIRLPEALEEKLLCPFQYFGVADPVALDADRFWSQGKYADRELEAVYTGGHALALQRLDVIREALLRYEPDLSRVKGIGFCVTVRHAEYMARMFTEKGIPSEVLVGDTSEADRSRFIEELRSGKLAFLFTRDVLNEGLDVPEVNTVLFLRPTESLTVFLQQLGRGLRRAPGKDCLTVLDFVGQAHHRYRVDRKFKALLPRHRYGIDREIEQDFPHLPPGCAIQLDKIAKERVLENIRWNLKNLKAQIPERLKTFEVEAGKPLTFGNFIRYHDFEPEMLLARESWSGWKAMSGLIPPSTDQDHRQLKGSLVRATGINGPQELDRTLKVTSLLREGNISDALEEVGDAALLTHYRFWGKGGKKYEFQTQADSFARIAQNPTILADMEEVLLWAKDEARLLHEKPALSFPCPMELHAQYGSSEINAALGLAGVKKTGPAGVGMLHAKDRKAYAMIFTFQKTEKQFSPSTMYADYPISRDLIHWESQSTTSEASPTGQNIIKHVEKGYTVLLFARNVKLRNGVTVPFTYLGPADLVSYEKERPIRVIWRLRHPMPAGMFEENQRGG